MKGLPPNSSFALQYFLRHICTQSILPKHVLLFRNNPILISVLNFCNDFSATEKLFQASGCLSLLCIQQLVDRILCARHTIFRRYLTAQNLVSHIQKKLLCLKACIARECGP